MPRISTDTGELSVTPSERANLLRVMESRHRGAPASSKRGEQRHSYEPDSAPMIELEGEPGGIVAVARNLSKGGLAFMHGAPLATGTRCSVTLFDATGAATKVGASVARCQKLAGRIHDIGVKFDGAIEVSRFMAAPVEESPEGVSPAAPGSPVARLYEAVRELRMSEGNGMKRQEMRSALAQITEMCRIAMEAIGPAQGAGEEVEGSEQGGA